MSDSGALPLGGEREWLLQLIYGHQSHPVHDMSLLGIIQLVHQDLDRYQPL